MSNRMRNLLKIKYILNVRTQEERSPQSLPTLRSLIQNMTKDALLPYGDERKVQSEKLIKTCKNTAVLILHI